EQVLRTVGVTRAGDGETNLYAVVGHLMARGERAHPVLKHLVMETGRYIEHARDIPALWPFVEEQAVQGKTSVRLEIAKMALHMGVAGQRILEKLRHDE